MRQATSPSGFKIADRLRAYRNEGGPIARMYGMGRNYRYRRLRGPMVSGVVTGRPS